MSASKHLIKELYHHNQEAFSEVYNIYNKLVYYVIYSIVYDKEATKELVQDTFMKMWLNIDSFSLNSNFRAWLLTIAKNTAKDYLRTRKQYQQLDDDVLSNQQHLGLFSEFDVDAKNVLNKIEYDVVVLTIVYNLKRREVAQYLEKPVGTVLRIYNEAIKKLREFYDIEDKKIYSNNENK